RVLTLGRQAASQANAHADQAYFDHEDQVRRRCLGLASATGAAIGTAFAVGKHVGASQAASPPAAAPAVESASVRKAGKHLTKIILGAGAIAAAITAVLALVH